jgi:hypothetical protein
VLVAIQFILSDYVAQAMTQAVYDKLEGGTFAERIPLWRGWRLVLPCVSVRKSCAQR